jgi:subtilase family serine protease
MIRPTLTRTGRLALAPVAAVALGAMALAAPAHAAVAPDSLGPDSVAAQQFAHPDYLVGKRAPAVSSGVTPFATSPTGLSPAKIKAAYSFSTSATAGSGRTIAIVDAYNDPTAAADLAKFSTQYGLPAASFTKVSQTGSTTSLPATNASWALEISLDIEWAHAIAPGAKILLVEASSNSDANLFAAENYAKAHATYVSNSWGGAEFSGESSYDSTFSASGVSFFVSAGDDGLGAEYPSASKNVISVGGTTLNLTSSGAVSSETAWSDSGGGCSAYESPAAAQAAFAQYKTLGCGTHRATPDLSLDANPSTGVSVYDSTPYQGSSGWWTVGGTSASAPMIAARGALGGSVDNAARIYGTAITYRDITSGSNGASAKVGEDLVTGRGSWTH